jgi:hypothetical protein
MAYASEVDVLNVALFGIAAKQWRKVNPDKSGLYSFSLLKNLKT